VPDPDRVDSDWRVQRRHNGRVPGLNLVSTGAFGLGPVGEEAAGLPAYMDAGMPSSHCRRGWHRRRDPRALAGMPRADLGRRVVLEVEVVGKRLAMDPWVLPLDVACLDVAACQCSAAGWFVRSADMSKASAPVQFPTCCWPSRSATIFRCIPSDD
jgi:hypothetical protein